MKAAWSRPGVAADLAEVDVRDRESLLTLFAAEGAALKAYAKDAAVQRDDRMTLEFSGPRSIYGRTAHDNAATLRRIAAGAQMPAAVREAWNAPATAVNRGAMHLRAEAFRIAFDDFERALEHTAADAGAVDGLLRAAAGARRLEDAEAILKRLVARNRTNVTAVTALSHLTAARGDFSAAAEVLRPLLTQPKPEIEAIDQLASIFADAGDADSLAAVVGDLQRVAPDSEPALYYAATLHFMANRTAQAIEAGERLRARNSRHARCLNMLGAAYATIGRPEDARRAFEASIDADPRDPAAYVNLGTFELQAGRAADAENYFAEALTLDPSSAAAQQGLAQAETLRRQ